MHLSVLLLVSFFLPFFSSRHYPYLINIKPPYLWPGVSFLPSSLHQSPILLTLLFLTTSFPFPFPSLSPSLPCFFFFLQVECDLTLINKLHLPRWSGNRVQMQKIDFPQLLFFSVSLMSAERERASEKHVVLLR